ncbi:MAG: outer membrane protein assembly factor BamA [Desulfobulbus propionicus]|nr:MAG: outer membrane protein assembly factor BamA [Desulfobulbus propionicus]
MRSLTHLQRHHLFFLLLTSFVLYTFSPALALEQNTAFLPLKINAPDADSLQAPVDRAMADALSGKQYVPVPRSTAETLINYQKPWPPSTGVINTIAQATGYDYVALGSLTQLGGQYSFDFTVFDVLQPGNPYTSFRETSSLGELEGLLSEAISEAITFTHRSFTIASIAPAGNVRIDSGAILRKISTKPGDLYNPANLRKDLKTVFSMGYFDNVEIESTDSPLGKQILFRVEEKPLIGSVVVTGTDNIKEEDVLDAANIATNTILNPTKINDAATRVKELYKSKGYYNTKVETNISYPTEDSAEIRLAITEGEKITVEEITFQGNTTFDDDELEDIIQTGTYSWWTSWLTDSGLLKMDILKQDAARLGAFYQNHGFIEAKVGSPIVEQKEEGLYITFPIEEGPRFRVGTVEVEGDLIKEKDELISLLQIRQEPFLNRQTLREDSTRITDVYAESGYAFAVVTPKINRPDAGHRVDILFKVDKGSLVYFNRVEIEGNTRTRDNVIRRDLKVKEGGLFDSKAIRRSTQKLQRLNFFEEVTVTPKPTLNEDQMDVLVNVKEKPTGQFSVGAGYSSSESLILMGEISENNFLGTGNNLALAANLSGQSARYNLKFTNPRMFDSNVSGGVDMFNWEREYTDYTRESMGAGLRFGHPLWGKWYIYYGYTIEDTELSDISTNASEVIKRSAAINMVSSARVSVVRDTRDRTFAPSRGSRNAVSIEYAGGPLGGDAQFSKIEGSTSWYFPMMWDTVFHVKAAAGQAFENEDDKLPIFEHFYLGGMKSIRGFDSYSISPIDAASQEKIGGDKMWYGTISVIFPLVKDMGIQGEIFHDFGNVYGEDEDWDIGDYKKTAGVGILWLSPLGPLKIAWGFNLDQQQGEDSSNWDFSMGGTF